MSQPTAYEQYVLELINRGRANPGGTAAGLGIGLNDGLPAGTISGAPEQPLAFDPDLIDAAQQHSAWMLSTGTFSHTGANGSSPGDRMAAAGYGFGGAAWGWGENIATMSGIGVTLDQATANQLETMLVKSPEHRENLLDPSFSEVGVGFASGQGTVMLTQDFAYSGSHAQPFLTGVAFDDLNGDNFYEPGEGLGGISVVAKSNTGAVYQTTTWNAGGYQMELPAGTYQVTFSGGALAAPVVKAATIGSLNAALDLESNAAGVAGGTAGSSGSGTSGGGTGNAGVPNVPPLPITTKTITGTAGSDSIVSLSGHTLINALGGNDWIFVGGAANVVNAGPGNDGIRVTGSGNLVDPGPGNNVIFDVGTSNTYELNAAGQGQDDFWGSVLSNGDVFDLRTPLAGTGWNNNPSTLGTYLHVGSANNGADTTDSITPLGTGSASSTIAVLHGQGATTFNTLLTHSII